MRAAVARPLRAICRHCWTWLAETSGHCGSGWLLLDCQVEVKTLPDREPASQRTPQMVDKDELLGVWRLVSAQVHMENSGEVIDVHGQNPKGSIIFEPSGRMMAIITNSVRVAPTTDAESAALYRGMTAYTGRYSIQQNTVVTRLDVAWHPSWENTEQRRFVELSGDTLKLSTPVQEHPSLPGQMHRAVFTWVREGT